MLKLAIIIGSTRPNRVGESVGKWDCQIAQLRRKDLSALEPEVIIDKGG